MEKDKAAERGKSIWERLRGKSRKELDRIELELVKRPGEKRQYAGDPNQERYLWIRTRNR